MNKKGVETTTIGVILGLLVALVLTVILIGLIWKFILPESRGEEDVQYFYFSKLAKDLIEMKPGEESFNFLTKGDFTLLSFNSNINIITKKDIDKCINYELEDIEKPVKCRDKNCLCICKSDLDQTANFYGGKSKLSVDCNADESRCVELPAKVNSICNHFILYDVQEKLYSLNVKKRSDAFTVNYTLSKTL